MLSFFLFLLSVRCCFTIPILAMIREKKTSFIIGENYAFISNTITMRALSKEDLKLSRENMRGAASLWKERQTLSLPPTCTQLVLCEKGKFSLDGSFSKNAPYKQKIIFHLTSIGKMSRKKFFFLGR